MNLLLAVRWRPIRCSCYLPLFEFLHIGIVIVPANAKGFLRVSPSRFFLIQELDRLLLMKIMGRVLFFNLEEGGLRAKLLFKSFQLLILLEKGSQAKEINCWGKILVLLESLGLKLGRTHYSLSRRCLVYNWLSFDSFAQLKSDGCWLVIHHDRGLIKYLAWAAMVETTRGREVP